MIVEKSSSVNDEKITDPIISPASFCAVPLVSATLAILALFLPFRLVSEIEMVDNTIQSRIVRPRQIRSNDPPHFWRL
jgi:hypothetical protein